MVDVEHLTSASELGNGLSGFDGTSNNLELLNVFVEQKLQATQLQATEPKVFVLVAGNDANASDYKPTFIFTEPSRNCFCKAIAVDGDGLRVVTEFTITTSS